MPPLELPLLYLPLYSYILSANLLTIFISYVSERKIIEQYIFDFIYLFLIISTLLLFFSVANALECFGIYGITIVVVCYILTAFMFVLIISYRLVMVVKEMVFFREYKKGLKKNKWPYNHNSVLIIFMLRHILSFSSCS